MLRTAPPTPKPVVPLPGLDAHACSALSPFDQLVAATLRLEAERRTPQAMPTPAETARAFKALARGALAGLAGARRAGPGDHRFTRASSARHAASSLALSRLYRRRATEASAAGASGGLA